MGESIDTLADTIGEQAGLARAFGAAAESHGDCDDRDCAGIVPFKPTTDFLISAAPSVVSNASLKNPKVAIKMPYACSSWELGTFRKVYKGAVESRIGTCIVYFR